MKYCGKCGSQIKDDSTFCGTCGASQNANENVQSTFTENIITEEKTDEPKIIQTNPEATNGQEKCPKCGATDISMNKNNGMLRCNFCRHQFEPEKATGFEESIENLSGMTLGSGATDIDDGAEDMLTFKCQSCGAEVVINTEETTQARCHWCRNYLSINQQIPNGSVPDVVLPFAVTKADAQEEIRKFVKKRSFFGNKKFKKEFTTENILGVYLPYMIVDVNAHVTLKGQGEHEVRSYTVGSGDDKETYYDVDLFDVEREFDIEIDDLTIESSQDKLDHSKKDVTNNIINSVMPFDTENAVKWNSNYLRGFNSEKRNVNINLLAPLVEKQSKDIARFKANETLDHYDRGVRWDTEDLDTKGQQWLAAYLPVWLYSYQQVKGDKKLLHYTAVNARTKETMGSVPINKFRLALFSFFVEILALLGMIVVEFDYEEVMLIGGPAFFALMYMRYRNSDARHEHETETKSTSKNMRTVDEYVKQLKGLSDSSMYDANNKNI